MASFLDLESTNWSYYSIPVAFVLCMAPHAYAVALAGKNYDISNPRKTEEICAKDEKMSKATLKRISRARAAAANGFETLGLYAAAITAGNAAGLATGRMNRLALTYVLSRAVYNYVYVVLQDNARLAAVRPLVWGVGIAVVMGLFVGAAGKL
ncbi:hypothetical protein VTJ49DRAFT_1935 [Mycothermus thermophilus]|uniref:Uncharacterized protein n=1 Tax=Humicola insolens TaxID=85995 RepID=A0ABR3VBM7_HUMIN